MTPGYPFAISVASIGAAIVVAVAWRRPHHLELALGVVLVLVGFALVAAAINGDYDGSYRADDLVCDVPDRSARRMFCELHDEQDLGSRIWEPIGVPLP